VFEKLVNGESYECEHLRESCKPPLPPVVISHRSASTLVPGNSRPLSSRPKAVGEVKVSRGFQAGRSSDVQSLRSYGWNEGIRICNGVNDNRLGHFAKLDLNLCEKNTRNNELREDGRDSVLDVRSMPQSGMSDIESMPQNGMLDIGSMPQNGTLDIVSMPQNGTLYIRSMAQDGTLDIRSTPQNGTSNIRSTSQNRRVGSSQTRLNGCTILRAALQGMTDPVGQDHFQNRVASLNTHPDPSSIPINVQSNLPNAISGSRLVTSHSEGFSNRRVGIFPFETFSEPLDMRLTHRSSSDVVQRTSAERSYDGFSSFTEIHSPVSLKRPLLNNDIQAFKRMKTLDSDEIIFTPTHSSDGCYRVPEIPSFVRLRTPLLNNDIQIFSRSKSLNSEELNFTPTHPQELNSGLVNPTVEIRTPSPYVLSDTSRVSSVSPASVVYVPHNMTPSYSPPAQQLCSSTCTLIPSSAPMMFTSINGVLVPLSTAPTIQVIVVNNYSPAKQSSFTYQSSFVADSDTRLRTLAPAPSSLSPSGRALDVRREPLTSLNDAAGLLKTLENRNKMYRCDNPDCDKTYFKNSHLKVHQRIHTGTFVC